MVQQQWYGCYGPHSHYLGLVHLGTKDIFLLCFSSRFSPWRPLLAMHSNPNPITSFNISIMRHWDGPAAMVWMFWSTQSLTWPCSLGATRRQLSPLPELKIQPVETLDGKAFHSKLHNIIQYIHDETLGWSSSNGLDVMVQTVTDLALFTWGHKTAFYPPRAQNSARGDHCWQSIPIQTA